MGRADHYPGSFSYSNSNYILLGAILRRATGASVEALLGEEILSRQGLRRTSRAVAPPSLRKSPEEDGLAPGSGANSSPTGAWFPARPTSLGS
jgi:CubicO group peptidase (beta-lactamase class C family)